MASTLENCFANGARPKDDAIDHAHAIRNLKQATSIGNAKTAAKQWAGVKFGKQEGG
ncbi:MAG: hypothetical protein WBA57_04405 [Elainellaceae cyanobacterium]